MFYKDRRTERLTDGERNMKKLIVAFRNVAKSLHCVKLCAYFPYDLCCAPDVSSVVIGNKITVPVGDRTLFT